MSKCRFKVGDHIKGAIRSPYSITDKGMTDAIVARTYGTPMYDDGDDMYITVISHDEGEIWNGEGFSVNSKYFDLITPAKQKNTRIILVTNDGTDTVAIERVDGKIINKTKARLHPNDEYKWETGRDLALNRLLYGTDYHPAEVALKTPTPEEPIRVGDLVKVTNKDAVYDTYSEWMEENGISNRLFRVGKEPIFGKKYVVTAIAPHSFGDSHNIYYITDENSGFIMERDGIERA